MWLVAFSRNAHVQNEVFVAVLELGVPNLSVFGHANVHEFWRFAGARSTASLSAESSGGGFVNQCGRI